MSGINVIVYVSGLLIGDNSEFIMLGNFSMTVLCILIIDSMSNYIIGIGRRTILFSGSIALSSIILSIALIFLFEDESLFKGESKAMLSMVILFICAFGVSYGPAA